MNCFIAIQYLVFNIKKVIGIPIDVAVMTNLTQEHLDYHGTMEGYAAAKARLFNDYTKPRICILNHDDDWFDYFAEQSRGTIVSYGQNPDSDIRIQQIKIKATGSSWQLAALDQEATLLHTQLAGEFNVYNATAASSVGLALDIPSEQIATGVDKLRLVPGRMETIDAGQDFTVLVDYAVTADALERVLQTARHMTKKRVLVVFGATGDRDRGKRPIMGEAAARNADLIFLTDDETYTEDGDTIRAAVRHGIEAANGNYQEIADRRAAIAAAFKAAKKGDIVVLTGMGHQDSRNMGGISEPWDEREVARELLKDGL